jgi:ankyrin repeat protein
VLVVRHARARDRGERDSASELTEVPAVRMGQAFSQQTASQAAVLVEPSLMGDYDRVRALLDGSKQIAELVGRQDEAGNHALGAASCAGHMKIVQLLLQHSAPVHLPNNMGTTPVWLAAGYGHLDVLDALLAGGGDPSVPSKSGDTPLMACLFRNHAEVAMRLIDLGANLNARNANGDSAVSLAASTGNARVLRALCSHSTFDSSLVNLCNKRHVYPLLASCANPDADCVAVLLEQSADLTVRDKNGATALHVAAHCGNVAALAAVLAADQSLLDLEDPTGATALWVAAAGNHVEATRTLLAAGADTSRRSQGLTPAQVAEKSGNPSLCMLFEAASTQEE